MEIEQTLTAYISDELLSGDPVDGDDHLLAEGMVDSLGMMRLIAYIEVSFAIKVPPEHFTIENFRTINAISAYLSRMFEVDA